MKLYEAYSRRVVDTFALYVVKDYWGLRYSQPQAYGYLVDSRGIPHNIINVAIWTDQDLRLHPKQADWMINTLWFCRCIF